MLKWMRVADSRFWKNNVWDMFQIPVRLLVGENNEVYEVLSIIMMEQYDGLWRAHLILQFVHQG